MHRYQHEAIRIMKNQANVTPPEESNKSPETDPKEMQFYKLTDKEFKIIILKKSNEMQDR